MKTKFLLSTVSLVVLMSACKLESNVYYDDVYTSSNDRQYIVEYQEPEVEEVVYHEPVLTHSSSETYYDENGNTYVTNNYYYDDYYDYAYAARIRRFHSDVPCWSYYDPYYTNMYWYDRCPSSFGVSIYLGYNWCWPSIYVRPYWNSCGYCSCGFSFAWGWNGCHCGGWYGPGWAYNSYWNGYHNGYRNGYNDGYYAGYYHNNYDRNRSYTYGHFDRSGLNNGKANNKDIERGNSPMALSKADVGYAGSNYANYNGSGVVAGANNRGFSPSSSFSENYENLIAATPKGKEPSLPITNLSKGKNQSGKLVVNPLGGNSSSENASSNVPGAHSPISKPSDGGNVNEKPSVVNPAIRNGEKPNVSPTPKYGDNNNSGSPVRRENPSTGSSSSSDVSKTSIAPKSGLKDNNTPANVLPKSGSSGNSSKPSTNVNRPNSFSGDPYSSRNNENVAKPNSSSSSNPKVSFGGRPINDNNAKPSSSSSSSSNGGYSKPATAGSRVGNSSNSRSSYSMPSTPNNSGSYSRSSSSNSSNGSNYSRPASSSPSNSSSSSSRSYSRPSSSSSSNSSSNNNYSKPSNQSSTNNRYSRPSSSSNNSYSMPSSSRGSSYSGGSYSGGSRGGGYSGGGYSGGGGGRGNSPRR